MDNRLKSMLNELGDAINDSLSESQRITGVISRIKADGYDVFVVLEATIGLHQQNESDDPTGIVKKQLTAGNFEMSSQDLKFLKSLRIKVEEGS